MKNNKILAFSIIIILSFVIIGATIANTTTSTGNRTSILPLVNHSNRNIQPINECTGQPCTEPTSTGL